MFSPAVLEELLLLKVSTATEFALRMISPSVRGEVWAGVKFPLCREEVRVVQAELAVVETVVPPHVSLQLGECLEQIPAWRTEGTPVSTEVPVLTL